LHGFLRMGESILLNTCKMVSLDVANLKIGGDRELSLQTVLRQSDHMASALRDLWTGPRRPRLESSKELPDVCTDYGLVCWRWYRSRWIWTIIPMVWFDRKFFMGRNHTPIHLILWLWNNQPVSFVRRQKVFTSTANRFPSVKVTSEILLKNTASARRSLFKYASKLRIGLVLRFIPRTHC
jgi:hypothetical protein